MDASEIRARLETNIVFAPYVYRDDLRYLLDLTAELQGRVSALEEALRDSWAGGQSGLYWCVVCETRWYDTPVEHAHNCIILTLPEPVVAEQ